MRPHSDKWALVALALVAGSWGPVLAQEGSGGGTGAIEQAAQSELAVDVDALEVQVIGPDAEATVGDLVSVVVSVPVPGGLVLERVESVQPGRLEFLDRDISVTEGRATARIDYVAFRPGRHRIEAFDLVFRQVDGSTVRRRVPGVEVPVLSVIANEQNPTLRPEKPGVPVRYEDYTLAWVGGIGGALLVMGLLGFLIARSRPRIVIEPPPPSPRPAHEIAFEKLDAIKRDELIEKGELMAFYVRLSEAVREYLGNRYGFDGLEMTTTEILGVLETIRLPGSHDQTSVGHLLYGCDLVKFAKGLASISEEKHALDGAYGLVQDTMLVALADQAEGAAAVLSSDRPPAPANDEPDVVEEETSNPEQDDSSNGPDGGAS